MTALWLFQPIPTGSYWPVEVDDALEMADPTEV